MALIESWILSSMLLHQHISPRYMIKVDLQKAYDSVEWGGIEQLLKELAFPAKFVTWILKCITVNYSICINGELTEEFNAKRGLRQGDPLSPTLLS